MKRNLASLLFAAIFILTVGVFSTGAVTGDSVNTPEEAGITQPAIEVAGTVDNGPAAPVVPDAKEATKQRN